MDLTIGTTTDGAPFTLPIGAVTQKFALFAQSGAGKSYAAMKMAEELLAVGAQVIALDPVGIWWGLPWWIGPTSRPGPASRRHRGAAALT